MTYITAVGMRFRGYHSFLPENIYQLEADPTNPHDSNAIKIMHNGTHVAFVARTTQSRAEIGRDYTMRTPETRSRDYCDLVFQEVQCQAEEAEGKTNEWRTRAEGCEQLIRTQREQLEDRDRRIKELENEVKTLRAQPSRAKRVLESDGEDSRPSQKIKTNDGETKNER
tara:strand:+ start:168 stop:674 length:507 start_codon:yes stop_codon:yes gene_type:complete